MAAKHRYTIVIFLALAIAISPLLWSAMTGSSGQNLNSTPMLSSSMQYPATQTIVNELQQAVVGLLYTSESDFPFVTVTWTADELPVLTPETLLTRIGRALDTPITTITLDSLFEPLVTEQDWHSAEDKITLDRYRRLLEKLREHLQDIQVFRVGEIEIDIYILGKTASGDWTGLATKAVET